MTMLALALCASAQFAYPPTRTVDARDTYFGKTYEDRYRWLENLKQPSVETWFKSQASLTDDLLGRIPARDKLAEEWMQLDKLQPARYRSIGFESGRVFYKKTLGGENVGKLYMREGWTGEEKLLFDPQSATPKGAKKGAVISLRSATAAPDGKHVLLALESAGAEWSELRVLDVASRQLLPERMYPAWDGYGWTMDSKAFFYDSPKVKDIKSKRIELDHKLRLHRLGTKVASDPDLLSNESYPELKIESKEWPAGSIDETAPDYILANVGTVQNEQRFYSAKASSLSRGGKLQWKEIARLSDNLVRGFSIYKDLAYAVTHSGAPRYKLVRTSLAKPDWANAETVIPEAQDSIQSLSRSRDYLFVVYSNGVVSRVVRLNLASGATSDLNLPASGTALVSCPDAHSNHCIFFTTSWIQPIMLWDYDGDQDTFAKSVFNTDVTYPGFDRLTTEEVEVPGEDGTPIPLSIVHRKDLKLDGSASTILEGYGSYGISLQPFFTVMRSIALHDVVYAVCHVRGGGEKGEAWYKSGYKKTKPNTWKDFISCGEYLTKKGYTSPGKLTGTGTSAGGILITRAITERPDLFAAAVCNVGCANAMRMEFSANGPVNTPEFGTVKNEDEAAALYEMDGVQHVKPGVAYPAVMGVGGWNDPRVAPWQPGKFVAAMQSASTSGKPVLMKVNYDNGHFTEEKIVTFKNFASQMSFLLWQTGHPEFQPREQ
jgi:prolyl oligopeptidase